MLAGQMPKTSQPGEAGSSAGPDSPHVSGQCDNPERIALILDASAVAVARSLDYDI
jgi:hypothetical protein